jgi:MFS family permease
MSSQLAAAGQVRAPAANGRAAAATLIYLGFALQLLQAGIVPLLPTLGVQLHLSSLELSWLLTSGLLSGAVALAVISRLADMFGKRTMMVVAMVVVLAGAILGSFSGSFGMLLVARILMGAQLPMLALPEAVASDTMPPQRAQTAISAIHASTGAGIAGGIVLAALVGSHPAAWHAYFYVSAAVTAFGIAATLLAVRESPARAPRRIDVAGVALLALGLVGVLLGLSEGPTWGWSSARVIASLVVGAALLAGCLAESHRARFPLLPWRSMASPVVGLALAVMFFVAFGVYGGLSAFTLYATARPLTAGYGWGYTLLDTAWFALPVVVGASACVTVVVAVARRSNRGVVAAVGGFLCLLAYLGFAAFRDSHAAVMVAVGLYTLGTALALAAAQILIVRAVPRAESGIALGTSIMMYAVGQALGTDVAGVYFRSYHLRGGHPAVPAFTATFLTCAAVSGVLVILSGLRAARAEAAQQDRLPG